MRVFPGIGGKDRERFCGHGGVGRQQRVTTGGAGRILGRPLHLDTIRRSGMKMQLVLDICQQGRANGDVEGASLIGRLIRLIDIQRGHTALVEDVERILVVRD